MKLWKNRKGLTFVALLVLMGVMASGCGAGNREAASGGEESEAVSGGEESEAASGSAESESASGSAERGTADQAAVDDTNETVGASALNEGTYAITVESSSSMFQIVDCQLTVANGAMTAAVKMSGTGYLKVFMGTAKEAAKAPESEMIPYQVGSDGAHIFTVPVKALDTKIECSAFSKKKEQWYERTLVFRSDSLPEEAFAQSGAVTAKSLGLQDGVYDVAVDLEGGSGRAKILSPTRLTVADGKMTATIIWGSSNYDYMRVGEEKFMPKEGQETATFEIPVAALNRKIAVYADTTAMSQPHEISYTLYFHAESLERVE